MRKNVEENQIYHIDILKGLQKMSANTVDLIVTSPPYNIGIDYGEYKDELEWQKYLDWCLSWLRECYRVLKDDGRVCIDVLLDIQSNEIREQPQTDFVNMMRGVGIHIHGIALWTDATRVKYTAWGSWQSCTAPYIYVPYEAIIIGYKSVWKKQTNGESDITKKEFIEATSGLWALGTESRFPAAFPEKLPKMCIKLLTYKKDLVLDPLLSCETTAVAAKKLGRRFIGFEIDKSRFNIGKRRLSAISANLFT